MTLETFCWIVAIIAIHGLGVLTGYIIAPNKRDIESAQYIRMALELILTKAQEIKTSNYYIDNRLREVVERFDKTQAELEAKQ